jgi:peptide/nickel transport system substrate-binding protein
MPTGWRMWYTPRMPRNNLVGRSRAGHPRLAVGALRIGILAVLMSLVSIAGVAAAENDSETPAPVLIVGVASPPPGGLDPTQNPPGGSVTAFAYEPLIRWLPDGSLGPGLATSWRYIKGKDKSGNPRANQDFELTLRHDARFSDGTRVTAQAVKKWLEYFASANPVNGSAVGRIESIDTIGRWKLRIHLADPNPVLPRALATGMQWGYVAGPKALADPSTLATETDGAGPYVLDPSQSVDNSTYTLLPNPYYHDQSAIRFRKVVVRVIPSAASMLEAITTGQVDVAQGTTSTADAAAAATGVDVLHASQAVGGLWFLDRSGTLSTPIADVRVRQALNYAIDREAITQSLIGRYGEPTSQVITTDGFDPEFQDYYDHDPQKAASLLADAGYPDGFTLEMLAESPNFQWPLTDELASDFAAVGVELDVTRAESAADFGQKVRSGTFPAYIASQLATRSMWDFYTWAMAPQGAPLNQHGWSDPVLDELWLDGQRAADPTPYWQEMSRRSVTEAYFVPVFTIPNMWYVSDKIGGVEVTSEGSPHVPSTPPTEWFPR